MQLAELPNQNKNKMNIDEPIWKQEWLNMPEFVQEKQKPYAQIILRVESKRDLQKLELLLGQKFTTKTKSAWYPARSHWGLESKKWTSNES